MILTKQEVARRQLVTAINLFFNEGDSVSIYTLGQAAWEVVDSLCKYEKKIRFREEMRKVNKKSKREINNIISYGRNFFKHANTDPEGILEDYHDEFNDNVLMAASFDYTTISDNLPIEMQLIKLWYFAVYPEKKPHGSLKEIAEVSDELFPKMNNLGRKEQKLEGKKALIKAKSNPKILLASDTDRKPVGSIRLRTY